MLELQEKIFSNENYENFFNFLTDVIVNEGLNYISQSTYVEIKKAMENQN